MQWRTRIGLLLAAAALGTTVYAYNFTGARWLDPRIKFYTGMSGTSQSGVRWSDALREAMQQWTDQTAFDFVADPSPLDPCAGLSRSSSGSGDPSGPGDELNSADFRYTLCGNSFGSNVLAITLYDVEPGSLGFSKFTETDIVFNANFDWDIYHGPKQGRYDFRRVALHEFGHALGLDHESKNPAIMAPRISDLDTLQLDDINGANALYSGSGTCSVRDLRPGTVVNDSLDSGDCRVRDLLGGSSDTSFVDVYKLVLERETKIDIVMQSTALDSVLILANANLGGLDVYDDTDGACDARIKKTLPAGEYRILANTYDEPKKCAGNTGAYRITVSDTGLPLLGSVGNANGGSTLASAVITGGATTNGGASYETSFTASQPIDVSARIVPAPEHVGLGGRMYVLAVLGNGSRYIKDATGRFVPFAGTMIPARVKVLEATEELSVAAQLRGSTSGLAGQTISVFVGYALDSNPAEIWYGKTPIRFTIAP